MALAQSSPPALCALLWLLLLLPLGGEWKGARAPLLDPWGTCPIRQWGWEALLGCPWSDSAAGHKSFGNSNRLAWLQMSAVKAPWGRGRRAAAGSGCVAA